MGVGWEGEKGWGDGEIVGVDGEMEMGERMRRGDV